MVITRASMRLVETDSCHGGKGKLTCTEMLADYDKNGPGFTYLHDDVLAPGASIGEHTHHGNEEVYLVLEGHGTILVNGEPHAIGPGEMAITRDGHSHGLVNGPDAPMRLLVMCTNL